MGFCTEEEVERFFRQCPAFERMLLDDGVLLVKYWFSVSDEEQDKRFKGRLKDPLRRWKLSDMDLEGRNRSVEYSKAKDEMFAYCDTPDSPWWDVEADDKQRARINCMAHLLSVVPYEPRKIPKPKWKPRPKSDDYRRPPETATATCRTTPPPSLPRLGRARTARRLCREGGQRQCGGVFGVGCSRFRAACDRDTGGAAKEVRREVRKESHAPQR